MTSPQQAGLLIVSFLTLSIAGERAAATSVSLEKAEEVIRFNAATVGYVAAYARFCPALNVGKYVAPAHAGLMVQRDEMAVQYDLSAPERLVLGEAADEMAMGTSANDMSINCRYETIDDILDYGFKPENADGHDHMSLSVRQLVKMGLGR